MDGARRFDSDTVLHWIGQLPAATRYWVGFSGGADSTALLLALHAARGDGVGDALLEGGADRRDSAPEFLARRKAA